METFVQEIINNLNDSKNSTSPFSKLVELSEDNKTAEAVKEIQQYFKCDEITAKLTFIEFQTQFYDLLEEYEKKQYRQGFKVPSVQEMINTINYSSEHNITLFYDLEKLITNNKTAEAIRVIQQYFCCDETTAKLACCEFRLQIYDEMEVHTPKESKNERTKETGCNNVVHRSMPKCPTCGSPRIKRIMFGGGGMVVAGNYGWISKTFECKDCGYMW